MHEMQTIFTDVLGVCLSRMHRMTPHGEAERLTVRGHSVQPLPNHFCFLLFCQTSTRFLAQGVNGAQRTKMYLCILPSNWYVFEQYKSVLELVWFLLDCELTVKYRMHDMQTIVTDDRSVCQSAVYHAARLGFTVQKRPNGSKCCLGWTLLVVHETFYDPSTEERGS